MGYKCSKTKDEILNTIANEFERVKTDYDNSLKTNNRLLQERNQGRYVAMFDLVDKLEIYEK